MQTTEQLIRDAYQRFLEESGPGQSSLYRFAEWIIHNEFDLAVAIMEDRLRSILTEFDK